MRIALFDYEAGNIHSLAKSLATDDVEVTIERDPRRLVDADAVVLPGVGAFDAAAARLAPGRDALRAALADGLPCLGICLGMQLFYEGSEESALDWGLHRPSIGREADGSASLPVDALPPVHPTPGLALLAGSVTRLRARHVPQIGWNELQPAGDGDPLLTKSGLDTVYYANSFVCRVEDEDTVCAWSEHEGDRFAAMVRTRRVVGVQFHPEKSSVAGVRFVHAWLDEARAASVAR